MRISRILLTGAAVGTIVGTGRADLNTTHVTNPKWPPHARFHGIAGWGTIAGSQLLGLWLLWRPRRNEQDRDLAVKTAAALSALAWLPFFAGSLLPAPRSKTSRGIYRGSPESPSPRARVADPCGLSCGIWPAPPRSLRKGPHADHPGLIACPGARRLTNRR